MNMEQNFDNNNLRRAKSARSLFLKHLQSGLSIDKALKESELKKDAFYRALTENKTFARAFRKVIDFRLETAFLDNALNAKTASILTFALAVRMPEKYGKNPENPADAEEEKQQIIFVEKGPPATLDTEAADCE